MRKKLLHNWGLKLVSLLIAFGLWFFVVTTTDPPDTRVFSNIPVTLINTELLTEQNKVYEILDNTDRVRVTVQAPRSVFQSLRASDIVAVADVSQLTNINTIAITYSISNIDVEVSSITGSPGVIQLNVEDVEMKWIPVRYSTVGEPAEGYMVYSTILDQNQIRVTGPASAVDRISEARVQINVDGAASNTSVYVEPLLYDAEGNLLELSNITKNVISVHMSVEILATKEVPIEINIMGVPAEGYLLTGAVQSDPETVMIAGAPSVLANVSKISIPKEQLDLTDATGNLVKTVNIRSYLPDTVKLADTGFGGRVLVSVYVEPETERNLLIPLENIAVTNLPEGYGAEFSGELTYFRLRISGLNEVVSAVRQNQVTGTVDIGQWMTEKQMEALEPGIYEVPVNFDFLEDISVDGNILVNLTIFELEGDEQDG